MLIPPGAFSALLSLLCIATCTSLAAGCGYQHVKHHYSSAVERHLDVADATLRVLGPLWHKEGNPIPGLDCSGNGTCQTARRKLREQVADNPYPIRIASEFQISNLPNATQALARTLVQGATRTLQKFLQVREPVHGNLRVTPTCTRTFFREVNGVRQNEWCNQIDPDFSAGTQQVCTQVKMNRDHFGSAVTRDEQGNNEVTHQGGEGQPVDMYVYVTAKGDGSANCGADYLAYAQPCYFDLVNGRPVVAAVNICPSTLMDLTEDSYEFDKQMDVIVHELVHSLGFTNDLFKMFWDPTTKQRIPEAQVVQQNPSPFSASRQVTWIVSPSVAREAQQHYGCSSLVGMPMEDEGGNGVELSHWEFRITQGELMSPITPMDGSYQQMSRLTLALLEDTGWYVVNYNEAGYLDWGNKAGCNFVKGTCAAYMNSAPGQHWYCTPDQVVADCTSTLEATGNCTQSSSLRTLANGCAMVQAFGGLKNCQVAGSVDQAVSDYPFWAYGAGARCVQVNYPITTPTATFPAQMPGAPQAESYCLNFTCQQDQLYITILDKTLPCPEGDMIDLKAHFRQFTGGSVGPCPAASRVCPSLQCSESCNIPYGGNCREAKCYCNIGYTGTDCTTRYSGLPPLPPAPQSSLPPSTYTNLPQTTPTQVLDNAAKKAQDWFTDPKNRLYIYIAAAVVGGLLLLMTIVWCFRRAAQRRQDKYPSSSRHNSLQMTAHAAGPAPRNFSHYDPYHPQYDPSPYQSANSSRQSSAQPSSAAGSRNPSMSDTRIPTMPMPTQSYYASPLSPNGASAQLPHGLSAVGYGSNAPSNHGSYTAAPMDYRSAQNSWMGGLPSPASHQNSQSAGSGAYTGQARSAHNSQIAWQGNGSVRY